MSYKNKRIILLLMLLPLFSACNNFAVQGASNSMINIESLSGGSWESIGYDLDDNAIAYCVIDGGRNNIRIILEYSKQDKQTKTFVQSTREMIPGSVFSINSGENSWKSHTEEMSLRDGISIVDDLLSDHKLYLRWSEPDSSDGGRRVITNIVSSGVVMAPYNKCQEFINNLVGKDEI